MGVFGAIPATVSHAITAGHAGAVTVEVGGTLMSLVPDAIRDTPQVWWTRLGSFIESENLVSGRHATSQRKNRDGWKLNRLRFVDYLPGAKVLVWPTDWTVFIYVRHGLGKREAARAVRLALSASDRPQLSVVHASLIGAGVAGGLHLPLWVSHWPFPKGAIGAAGGSLAVAAVFGASGLVFQGPAPDGSFGGATVGPVAAQPAAPAPPLVPLVPQPGKPAHATVQPSMWVQVAPGLPPHQIPTSTPTPTPSPTPTPTAVPSPTPTVPEPLPSSQVPPPMPSGVPTDAPSGWWFPVWPPNARQ